MKFAEKFYNFYEFITENMIYPLGLSFIAIVAMLVVSAIVQSEVIWLLIVCAVLASITALWLAVFLVAFTIQKIIDYREEKMSDELYEEYAE